MALTYTHRPGGSSRCPQCREPISREANVCPHCRSDLTNDEQWQQQRKQVGSGCAMLLVGMASAAALVALSRWVA